MYGNRMANMATTSDGGFVWLFSNHMTMAVPCDGLALSDRRKIRSIGPHTHL